jgi:FtsH-binding integral membrane protein
MDPNSPDIRPHTAFRRGWETFDMANWSDPQFGATPSSTTATGVAVDAGLRAHMLSVYNYMASGILLTGIVALLIGNTDAIYSLRTISMDGHLTPTVLGWVVAIAPHGVVLWLSFGINRISAGMAQFLFWTYAALVGASLSTIFLVYTEGSIALTFFATAAAFSSLSLYGYTTKRDLSGMGQFLLMGVVGLLVAMLINVFWVNDTFSMVIAAIGVFIFAGLTAYDTQKIKSMYYHQAPGEGLRKDAIMGALNLYLDFINMFLFLLRFLGNSRN